MQTHPLRNRLLALFGILMILAVPAVGQQALATEPPPVEREYNGVVEARPATVIGDWQVSDRMFVVTGATRFPEGLPVVGDCVEVRYVVDNQRNLAQRIKRDDDCADPTPSPSATPDPSVTPTPTHTTDPNETPTPTRTAGPPPEQEEDFEIYARIDAFPATLFGDWRVGGRIYEARDGITRFEEDYGPFAIGRCVEVEYRIDGERRIATEIETRPDIRCPRPGQVSGVFYGPISFLPDTNGSIGTWVIGGLTFLVEETTVLERGPFSVGQYVEVRFTVDSDGTLLATRIIGRGPRNDDQREHDRRTYRTVGRIESLPDDDDDDLEGEWTISGQDYTVTERTRLRERRGQFEEGACVEVYYRRGEDGERLARRIHTVRDGRCEPVDERLWGRAFGFVEEGPSSGYLGEWLIGGENYTVNAATRIWERRGPLSEEAFVRVNYYLRLDGTRVAVEITTLVPPDCGEIDQVGPLRIDDDDDDDNDRSRLAGTDELWFVDGVAYVITEATLIDESLGEVTDGTPVRINAYVDEGGMYVATVVRAVEELYTVKIPMVWR